MFLLGIGRMEELAGFRLDFQAIEEVDIAQFQIKVILFRV